MRRGYFVEGLGAAQFATPATVDRLRTFTRDPDARPCAERPRARRDRPREPVRRGPAVARCADDPPTPPAGRRPGTAPGRKAGALVALVDGHLALYLERGGKSALTFTEDAAVLHAAAAELASVVRARLRSLKVQRVNSQSVFGTPLAEALEAAGFVATPQGLRLRV